MVIAVVSFFGVRGIVQQVFEGDLKQAREQTTQIVVEASTAAALAKNAAERAGNAADEVENDFNDLKAELAASRDLINRQSKLLEEIGKRATTVELNFQKIDLRIASVQSGAETLTTGSIDAVLARIGAVEEATAKLAEAVGAPDVLATLAANFEKATDDTRATLETVQSRSEVSIYFWTGEHEPSKIDPIIANIKDLGYPVPFESSEPGFETFYDLVSVNEIAVENILRGEVLLNTGAAPTSAVDRELPVLEKFFAEQGMIVHITQSENTIDSAVQIAIAP